jgi:hypothetical protein
LLQLAMQSEAEIAAGKRVTRSEHRARMDAVFREHGVSRRVARQPKRR